MSEKYPIEMEIQLVSKYSGSELHFLRKTVFANFVPQHGMEIFDSGMIFKVKTIALAGLMGLRYFANLKLNKKDKVPEGDWNSVSKLKIDTDNKEKTLEESVKYFKKYGWESEE